MPVDVLDRDRGVVHKYTDGQRQAAERHHVDVSPSAESAAIDDSIASGIDTVMIRVERQLPRNSRIISAGERRGDDAFADHAGDRRLDEDRLVEQRIQLQSRRRAGLDFGSRRLTCAMMSSVEALPFFSTVVSTERWPSTSTRFCCGE